MYDNLILDPICWKECTDCDGNYISSIDVNEPWPPIDRIIFEKSFIFAWNFLVPTAIIFTLEIFLRFCSEPSKRLRYISDSSYWIYIIHLPLVFFIPAFFHQSEIHVFLKFIISSILVTEISFFSYQHLVRKTFIGEFLNGKKYD